MSFDRISALMYFSPIPNSPENCRAACTVYKSPLASAETGWSVFSRKETIKPKWWASKKCRNSTSPLKIKTSFVLCPFPTLSVLKVSQRRFPDSVKTAWSFVQIHLWREGHHQVQIPSSLLQCNSCHKLNLKYIQYKALKIISVNHFLSYCSTDHVTLAYIRVYMNWL